MHKIDIGENRTWDFEEEKTPRTQSNTTKPTQVGCCVVIIITRNWIILANISAGNIIFDQQTKNWMAKLIAYIDMVLYIIVENFNNETMIGYQK